MPRYSKPRKLEDWEATPEKRCYKCVIRYLYKNKLRGKALCAEFWRLLPNAGEFFEYELTDKKIIQRADKGQRYEREDPEFAPKTRPYWRLAKYIVNKGAPISCITFSRLCADPQHLKLTAEPEADTEDAQERIHTEKVTARRAREAVSLEGLLTDADRAFLAICNTEITPVAMAMNGRMVLGPENAMRVKTALRKAGFQIFIK